MAYENSHKLIVAHVGTLRLGTSWYLYGPTRCRDCHGAFHREEGQAAPCVDGPACTSGTHERLAAGILWGKKTTISRPER